MNSEVLELAAEVWVGVYDFWGCQQQVRTIPVRPTVQQARSSFKVKPRKGIQIWENDQ